MHVAFIDLLAEQHEDKAGYRDKGAERKRMALLPSDEKQASADDEPKNRGNYDDGRKALIAKPGTEESSQLEIAVAHAVLAG